MATRISEIFSSFQRIRKVIFYKESKSNKKNLSVRRGEGGAVARVSDFFSFFKRIQV